MLRGHYWTFRPFVGDLVRPPSLPASHPWEVSVDDAKLGPVRLTGRLHPGARDDALVILVHGLGGSAESFYVRSTACEVARRGLASLRVNLRGADGLGEDWYHAGLTSDLDAMLAHPALASFRRIAVVGYSLGGHLVLRWAAEGAKDRLVAAVAVCPPLDLTMVDRGIDLPEKYVYRRHVLDGLVAMFAEVAARRAVPISVAEAKRIRRIARWDDLVVVPRFGFRDRAAYYEAMSAVHVLGKITVPTLLVVGKDDPMIPFDTVQASLPRASASTDVRVVPGGHVGFPSGLDLGQRGERGIDAQVLTWLTGYLAG